MYCEWNLNSLSDYFCFDLKPTNILKQYIYDIYIKAKLFQYTLMYIYDDVLTLNCCDIFPTIALGVVGFTIITAAAAWLECGIKPNTWRKILVMNAIF